MRGNSGACVPHLHCLHPGSPPAAPRPPPLRHLPLHSAPPQLFPPVYVQTLRTGQRHCIAWARRRGTSLVRSAAATAQRGVDTQTSQIPNLCARGRLGHSGPTLLLGHLNSLRPRCAVCSSSRRFPCACRWRSLLRTPPPVRAGLADDLLGTIKRLFCSLPPFEVQ
jgi:hypothetical protein